jgi:hypothetical protein
MATETREPAALQKADLSGFSLLELRNRSGRGMTSAATFDSALSALKSPRKWCLSELSADPELADCRRGMV